MNEPHDERMRLTLKDMQKLVPDKQEQTVDPKTGEKVGKKVKLSTGGEH